MWFRTLADDIQKSYKKLRAALKAEFEISAYELSMRRSDLYQQKQKPGERFHDFASRVRTMAAPLNLGDTDIVSICIQGARPQLRPILAQAQPRTVADMLQQPVVASQALEETLTWTSDPASAAFVLKAEDDAVVTRSEHEKSRSVTFQSQVIDTRPRRRDQTRYADRPRTSRNFRPQDRSRSAPPAFYEDQRHRYTRRTEERRPSSRSDGWTRRAAQTDERPREWTRPRRWDGNPALDSADRRLQTPSAEARPCSKCSLIHRYRSCPAFGKQCFGCLKLNHFAHCCPDRHFSPY